MLGDGRQSEDDVPEDLHVGAAQAEHQERPELRVPGHAQDGLPAPGDHFLDQHPLEVGPRLGRGHRGQDVLVGLAHRFGIRQIQPHPAHVEFVDDLRGDDLQGHRITQVLRGPDRFFRAVGPRQGATGKP